MPLLEVTGLVKVYTRRRQPWQPPEEIRAVDGVTFTIEPGELFGLVGESGSGKTTTGRCVLRLTDATAGRCTFRGESVFDAPPDRLRALRREIQAIFQDPMGSLNPRMRADAIIEEGLRIHGIGTPVERRSRVMDLFELVGLDPADRQRHPHEFSGGQRQRIALARALALDPSLLVADEPVSALDVSIQAQIINLFQDLQERLGFSMLLISHDLRLVRHVCRRVAVMHRGQIVEMGFAADVFENPAHPYTRALLSAVPRLDGAAQSRVTYTAGPTPSTRPLREVSPGHWAR